MNVANQFLKISVLRPPGPPCNVTEKDDPTGLVDLRLERIIGISRNKIGVLIKYLFSNCPYKEGDIHRSSEV
jgi:hypothetical protein